MKHTIRLLVILFFMLSSATVLQAKVKVKTVGDYEYTYHDIKQNKIWITKITPKKTVSSTKLNIPSKIDGKKVYKLGSYSDIKRNDSDVANLFGLEFDEDNGAGYILDSRKHDDEFSSPITKSP